MSHEQRLSIRDVDPGAHEAVLGLERYMQSSGFDPALSQLVKIRTSQINGCAYCLDVHHREARALGENPRRLDVLSAWREAPTLFTEKEKAALALAEAVTLIGVAGVPDPVWAEVTNHFNEPDAIHLLMAIATINVWNRLAVSTHQQLPKQ
jgi:AhpD family alkylhydroperoxidase